MSSTATHLFTIHHYGHTQINLMVTWEVGIDLAIQASEQLSIVGRWKRDLGKGVTGLVQHTDKYFDLYIDGAITLRPLNTNEETT